MSNNFHESHWGQCLELLSHLCQYGEDILLVTGPAGIGKTTMWHALIRAETVNFQLIDLIATPDLSPGDITAAITSVEATPENPDTLLLIDDAENLSLDAITLLLQVKQRSGPSLHIVLFANEELMEKVSHSVLKEDFLEQIHAIEIEPLTLVELEAFLMHQLRDLLENSDKKFKKSQYKKIHSASNGIPAKALQMAKNILSGKNSADSSNQRLSPFAVGVTVSFGMLFCILALMWPSAEPPSTTIANAPLPEITEQMTQEPLALAALDSSSETIPGVMPEPAPAPEPEPTPIPQEPDLIPQPIPEPEITPKPELVSAPEALSDDDKIARLEKKLQALQEQLNNEQSARRASELKLQHANKKNVEKTSALKNKTLSFTRQESKLLTFPKHNFALQLLGSNNEKKVQNFIRENNLEGKAFYYKGIHKGRAWYVVVSGNYVNKFEAQQAIARLPYALKKLHPWPRQYSKIHDSIKSRNSNG